MFIRILILKKKILQELPETSNSLFRNLKKNDCITEKELKYFGIEFKNATNLLPDTQDS